MKSVHEVITFPFSCTFCSAVLYAQLPGPLQPQKWSMVNPGYKGRKLWMLLSLKTFSMLQDAILKLGPLPRLLNDISVALRNPQLHMPTNHQPDRPKDRLFTRPSFNRIMSSDFQSLMMRDLNRYRLMVSFVMSLKSVFLWAACKDW